MKSPTYARAPAITLAAYVALVGSMAYAIGASAGQVAVEEHAQHDCTAEYAVTVAEDADVSALHQNPALPAENTQPQTAAQTGDTTSRRGRRKSQPEASLFHFSF